MKYASVGGFFEYVPKYYQRERDNECTEINEWLIINRKNHYVIALRMSRTPHRP